MNVLRLTTFLPLCLLWTLSSAQQSNLTKKIKHLFKSLFEHSVFKLGNTEFEFERK